MGKIIDADVLIEEIMRKTEDRSIFEIIRSQKEVPFYRTARWIVMDNYDVKCPHCEKEWNYFDNDIDSFNYCPNCGIKIEKERKKK